MNEISARSVISAALHMTRSFKDYGGKRDQDGLRYQVDSVRFQFAVDCNHDPAYCFSYSEEPF